MKGKSDATAAAVKPPRRAAFGWLTGAIKLVALGVGAGVTMVALMSLVGLGTDNLWVQAAAAAAVALLVPLILVDRLLPGDGSSRPGLLTDLMAMSWMGTATAVVALGTTAFQAPLTAQASRFEDHQWSRLAWATRWAAGSSGSVGEDTDERQQPAATAADAESEAAPADEPEPTPTPTPAEGAEFTPAPQDDSERKPVDPAELFKQWAPSVVTINVQGPMGSGVGTGFVIDDRGTVATNHHVVENAKKIEIKLFSGETADDVELLESNQDDDLALLRMKLDQLPPPLALGVSSDVAVGEGVVVIGNPIGLEHTMTDGMVSARRMYKGKKYIQMSAPVSPGNSGGPVFNRYGDVIGVTVAKLFGENLNLAIPIDKLKPMIKSEYPDAHSFNGSRW